MKRKKHQNVDFAVNGATKRELSLSSKTVERKGGKTQLGETSRQRMA
jgi:hypothetical protein